MYVILSLTTIALGINVILFILASYTVTLNYKKLFHLYIDIQLYFNTIRSQYILFSQFFLVQNKGYLYQIRQLNNI